MRSRNFSQASPAQKPPEKNFTAEEKASKNPYREQAGVFGVPFREKSFY
jgi:hypothetical protein